MTDEPSVSSGELLFFLNREGLLPLYQKVRLLIMEQSPGVLARVQKTQISFLLQKPFAWVWLPPRQGIKGRPAQYLILSFASEDVIHSPVVAERVSIRPGLYTNHANLSDAAQLGGELAGLLHASLMLRNRKTTDNS